MPLRPRGRLNTIDLAEESVRAYRILQRLTEKTAELEWKLPPWEDLPAGFRKCWLVTGAALLRRRQGTL